MNSGVDGGRGTDGLAIFGDKAGLGFVCIAGAVGLIDFLLANLSSVCGRREIISARMCNGSKVFDDEGWTGDCVVEVELGLTVIGLDGFGLAGVGLAGVGLAGVGIAKLDSSEAGLA